MSYTIVQARSPQAALYLARRIRQSAGAGNYDDDTTRSGASWLGYGRLRYRNHNCCERLSPENWPTAPSSVKIDMNCNVAFPQGYAHLIVIVRGHPVGILCGGTVP